MGDTPAQKSFDHDFLYSKTVKIAHVELALRNLSQCLQATLFFYKNKVLKNV